MFDFGVKASLSKNTRKNAIIQQREKLCNIERESTCHNIPNPIYMNEVGESNTHIY